MRYVVAIMAACIAAAPLNAVRAFERANNVFILTDEEMEECEGDNCVLVSKTKLMEKIEARIDTEVKKRAGNCRGSSVWRPQ